MAPVCYPGDADELGGVVDEIENPPIASPDAPVIFVAFEFLTTDGLGFVGERFQLANYPAENAVGQTFEFFARRGLYLDTVLSHAGDRV